MLLTHRFLESEQCYLLTTERAVTEIKKNNYHNELSQEDSINTSGSFQLITTINTFSQFQVILSGYRNSTTTTIQSKMSVEPFTSSTMSIIFNSVIMVVHEGNSSSISPSYTNDTTPPSLTPRPQGKSTSHLEEGVTHGFSQGKIIAVAVMLILLSIFGSLGNGLVLYVFSKKSDKVTSTIFILALAWTDIFTCLIFMPFTVAVLLLHSRLYFAFFCKLYWFLNTSNVPLSAFIMVAIAVDR